MFSKWSIEQRVKITHENDGPSSEIGALVSSLAPAGLEDAFPELKQTQDDLVSPLR